MRHAQTGLKWSWTTSPSISVLLIPLIFLLSSLVPSFFYPNFWKVLQDIKAIYKCMPITYWNSNDRKHSSPSETESSATMSLTCKFSLKLWHLSCFLSSWVTVTWFSEVLSTHQLSGGAAGTPQAQENTFMQSICLTLGTQVLNCYSRFSFTV